MIRFFRFGIHLKIKLTKPIQMAIEAGKRLPFVSQSALAALLKIAKTEKLPDVTTRDGLRQARNDFVNVQTPFGRLHQVIDVGGGVSFVCGNGACWWGACTRAGGRLGRDTRVYQNVFYLKEIHEGK